MGEFKRASLAELFKFFVTMGCTAFGGPAAHLAIMQREAVEKRGWMSRQEFLDVYGLLNLIPGPNSTQMVMYFGHRHGGVAGMFVAGFGFILPAAAITLAIALAYVRYGALPFAQAILWGVQPIVIAVIASAMWRLVPSGLDNWTKRAVFVGAAATALLGVREVFVVLGSGLLMWLWRSRLKLPAWPKGSGVSPWGLALLTGAAIGLETATVSAANLFFAFTRIAWVLYGSGYLLVAYMQAELVDRLGWLSVQQMLDVLAMGQMTPGPFLTTATAAGMVIGGLPGAVAATVGIFWPSFLLIGLLGGYVPRLRNSKFGQHFLAGVNAAVVALLLLVAGRFIQGVVDEPVRLGVAALSLFALERFKLNSMLLLVLGAAFGLAWHMFL